MAAKSEAAERLGAIDAQLAAAGRRLETLDPGRERAHSLRAISETQLADDEAPAVALAFAEALAAVATAQHEHFPDDVFSDFDHLASVLLRAARAVDGPARVAGLCVRIVNLYAAFGRHSVIRFRYGHDFVYGFDWERWVSRDPVPRAEIGPFDVSFLAYMRERGSEIVAAIRHGHPRYPELPAGSWRNPFPFSRAPEHERRLLRDLARRDAVPVRAWRTDVAPDWRVGGSRERSELARALQIPEEGA